MTEAELQAAVIDLAHVFNWRVAHFRAALTARGWRTPVQADGAGFPDLILVRGERILAVELKTDKAKLTPAQDEWLTALSDAGVVTAVWRPRSWHEEQILAVLR